ncbi:LysE family translocator [Roseobacter denitrificans]|uniref:LysE family transport protein n=1 Tax=Roseobacter denitrificans (strain ATCC 33942 / OCh 114) TaxID=375451 RepID=Q16DK3_ROSDO|nr:LysE family translocator [Roseobacter denitrificans]ABG29940.1 LysE family transport protein [Roseobacter denitrificans OCh 114]AVL53152.1 LysE family translocator [Roseobacter denitrificans]SFG38590.1 Threonine/homoserine/homoserine lactone efflux protein [Roseobacter denitrificans OCh 114]
MTISTADLLLYAGALIILFLTPGPVWLALMARALSGGFAAAWPLAFGVAVGDILWPLVAVLGISWIVSVFDVFMLVLRWVACGVFIVMGIALIRHARHSISADSRLTRPGVSAGFAAGVIAILGNPKAVLFYMGVLPGFFDLRDVTGVDVTVIIAASVCIPLIGNLMIAACVGRIRSVITRPQTLARINVISGCSLILVGVLIPVL